MKKILGILLSGLLLVLLPACNKDGDLFFLSGMNSNELMANATDVVLTVATKDSVALTLAWTKSTLSVSNPDVSVPDNILSYTLQASASADFSTTLVESSESNLSKSYLGSELNTVATSLGLAAGTAVPVYLRLKGSIGNNMQPVYSNVVTVNVTPYRIDFTTGYILNASQEVTGTTLYSATENGIYTGFMGEYLRKHPDSYSEFTRLLDTTNVMSLLNTYGTYTCFAPDNKAMHVNRVIVFFY